MRGFIAGREQHGAAVRKRGLGDEVVREPVRELRERVRGERRDDEQVGAGAGGRRDPAAGERRASAKNVSARTNRSAPGVTSGTTSCPPLTSRRTRSHAL